MILSEDDKKFLLKNVPEASSLIEEDEIDELLDAINDFIIFGMDDDGNPDNLGREAQKVFDRIFSEN